MSITTRAAVCRAAGEPWEVTDVEVDDPGPREVRVRMVAAGLCHCDEHARTGRSPALFPLVGGHEGTGVVELVGPGVTRVRAGDPVILCAAPVCGSCRFCSTGRQNLCERGRETATGRPADGSARFHAGGEDLGAVAALGTLAGHLVASEHSVVPLREPLPMAPAALLGCTVPTGWGTAVHAAGVAAGDTVVVYGAGGVGASTVIGARLAGARHVVVVDPVPFKRERAAAVGATHTVATAAEAHAFVADTTWGRLAEHALLTVDDLDDAVLCAALDAVGKTGLVTVTARGDGAVRAPSGRIIGFQRRIHGARFGGARPLIDVPRLVSLHTAGRIDLDQLVTRRYPLDRIADAHRDARDGTLVRGVVVHDQEAAA
ncbi:alcohol dehydrogenase catalytic domain-containing protein [Pseudonocardia sp. KRD291]|uniref:alcohol dehydrogenase catalytic domain-containing protein n=1 Tax=Pseudonocardia sp. KRD291 TaxID=2792007 RepID=UPI001C49E1B6|nr:alcohol dehydrogenase catalytic domain-containing protein [Pseudonocardia sp. KRD291]MBW0103020.1 alcohol dehydrogenase catalytic domain-containing protein [Pseudonocardia sp. KRD291]